MVTVYTTKTCSYCHMVKKFLQMKNVEFQEKDVTDDPEKRQELFEATNLMTVPVIEKDGQFVVGFQPGPLTKLITQ